MVLIFSPHPHNKQYWPIAKALGAQPAGPCGASHFPIAGGGVWRLEVGTKIVPAHADFCLQLEFALGNLPSTKLLLVCAKFIRFVTRDRPGSCHCRRIRTSRPTARRDLRSSPRTRGGDASRAALLAAASPARAMSALWVRGGWGIGTAAGGAALGPITRSVLCFFDFDAASALPAVEVTGATSAGATAGCSVAAAA